MRASFKFEGFIVDSNGEVDALRWELAKHYAEIYRLLDESKRSCRYVKRKKKWDPYRIAERDGWICYLCGEEIDKTGHTKDKKNSRGASADHVMPLCVGGPDLESNVKATHYQCNIRKSYQW